MLLKAMEQAGELTVEQVQDQLYLTNARIGYRADFRIRYPSGEIAWAEAKGVESERWRIIKKLWKFYGPGALLVYKGTHERPYLAETIIPEKGGETNGRQEEEKEEVGLNLGGLE